MIGLALSIYGNLTIYGYWGDCLSFAHLVRTWRLGTLFRQLSSLCILCGPSVYSVVPLYTLWSSIRCVLITVSNIVCLYYSDNINNEVSVQQWAQAEAASGIKFLIYIDSLGTNNVE